MKLELEPVTIVDLLKWTPRPQAKALRDQAVAWSTKQVAVFLRCINLEPVAEIAEQKGVTGSRLLEMATAGDVSTVFSARLSRATRQAVIDAMTTIKAQPSDAGSEETPTSLPAKSVRLVQGCKSPDVYALSEDLLTAFGVRAISGLRLLDGRACEIASTTDLLRHEAVDKSFLGELLSRMEILQTKPEASSPAAPAPLPVAASARRLKRKWEGDEDDDEMLLRSAVPVLPSTLVDCKLWHRSVVRADVASLHKQAVDAKLHAEARGQAAYSLALAGLHPTAVRLFQLQLTRPPRAHEQQRMEVTNDGQALHVRLR